MALIKKVRTFSGDRGFRWVWGEEGEGVWPLPKAAKKGGSFGVDVFGGLGGKKGKRRGPL